MPFYFAYGSNMNHAQMSRRCRHSRFLNKAMLEDYRFIYDGFSPTRKGAVANVIQDKGHSVWGGLFEIGKDDLAALDRYEGYPENYQRQEMMVKDEHGNSFSAMVYYREGEKPGTPGMDYRNVVKQGAIDCQLLETYAQQL